MESMDLSYIINEWGEDRDAYFNAMAPPIMQTSNFRIKTVNELRDRFADEYSGYIYSRGNNPTVDILRRKLAALDQAEDALVLNNGAAAIFVAIMSHVKTGDHVICVKDPYSWVQRMLDNIFSRFGVSTTYIDGTRIEHFAAALRPTTRFIYLESPNSWSFALQDIAAVVAFARRHGIVTLIDNSYCTPLHQRPIPMGIDICMQTATKYIGGHSDTLGGILTGTRKTMKKIFDSEYLAVGSGMQPFNAWLLIRGLRTLEVRLQRITETTKKVLAFLQSHPRVESVLFPLDPGFPQYELARRQMKGACGLISFYVRAENRGQIARFCENLKHISMAVSWGGHESLILPRCAPLADEAFNPADPQHRMLRLYVGLEAADYLTGDMAQSFDLSF